MSIVHEYFEPKILSPAKFPLNYKNKINYWEYADLCPFWRGGGIGYTITSQKIKPRSEDSAIRNISEHKSNFHTRTAEVGIPEMVELMLKIVIV